MGSLSSWSITAFDLQMTTLDRYLYYTKCTINISSSSERVKVVIFVVY